MQTTNGGDTATLRYRELTGGKVSVYVEEETSRDTEVDHAPEDVGYMVLWHPSKPVVIPE